MWTLNSSFRKQCWAHFQLRHHPYCQTVSVIPPTLLRLSLLYRQLSIERRHKARHTGTTGSTTGSTTGEGPTKRLSLPHEASRALSPNLFKQLASSRVSRPLLAPYWTLARLLLSSHSPPALPPCSIHAWPLGGQLSCCRPLQSSSFKFVLHTSPHTTY